MDNRISFITNRIIEEAKRDEFPTKERMQEVAEELDITEEEVIDFIILYRVIDKML